MILDVPAKVRPDREFKKAVEAICGVVKSALEEFRHRRKPLEKTAGTSRPPARLEGVMLHMIGHMIFGLIVGIMAQWLLPGHHCAGIGSGPP